MSRCRAFVGFLLRLSAAAALVGLYALQYVDVGGCVRSVTSPRPPEPTDVGGTYARPPAPAATRPATIDGVAYYYVAPPDRRERGLTGFRRLELGMTRERVRELLGEPDDARPSRTKAIPSRFLGWAYEYRLGQREAAFANSNDPRVFVAFDVEGRLRWAVSSGLPGLVGYELGGPGRR